MTDFRHLAVLAIAFYLSTGSCWGTEPESPPPARTLEIGMTLSPSIVAYSEYFAVSATFLDASLSFRLFNLAEVTARLHIPNGRNFTAPPLFGLEVCLAPRLGAYLPLLGCGIVFASLDSYYYPLSSVESTAAFYAVCAPLRWSLNEFVPLPDSMTLTLSLLELRYGSLLPTGENPSLQHLGHFYFSASIVCFGFYFTLL
jgi:hypothetical protein